MSEVTSWRLVIRALAAGLVAAIAILYFFGNGSNAGQGNNPVGPRSSLSVETSTGVYPFEVELADTDESRSRGLMFRREVEPGTGMLFDMGMTRDVAFWMHNTFVPLDIAFISDKGLVVSVAHGAKPQSDARIPSGSPVRFVLELATPEAKRIGLSAGDRVRHPAIDAVAGQ
ncbi:hypothetical protein CXZ10_04300 [Pleomorphomonas diazotrophica]|uniref:DUF192 domain-containing protein n=1 Tax=Pleomorphomonas diazotrophica TaxID=1166257 RepID=A0A1I4QKT2_9HYPH|nr:DUF192 domain-containing protein [Pleomorphomonas diazotrophica]PKR90590.1 hypothetical protein CXZ10_04300 [Pleomorphomonas diazotrophica]SFM40688.1 hypothetical protein SAMN05192571_101454 [Pleomorphomonas diazotrophica]